MDLFQKNICLVSARWWDSFKQYAATKYKIKFDLSLSPGLGRRNSWTGDLTPKNMRRMLSDLETAIDIPDLVGEDREFDKCNNHFRNQWKCIRRIDNHDLSGVFEGELRGGLDGHNDYVMLTPQMYDKLHLLYGGGPRYERSIIRGCLELYPFFVR